MSDFDPEERETYALFAALRDGVERLKVQLAERTRERLETVDDRCRPPELDRMVGATLLDLLNIVSRLIGRIKRPPEE